MELRLFTTTYYYYLLFNAHTTTTGFDQYNGPRTYLSSHMSILRLQEPLCVGNLMLGCACASEIRVALLLTNQFYATDSQPFFV